jgi:hypothetical protein
MKSQASVRFTIGLNGRVVAYTGDSRWHAELRRSGFESANGLIWSGTTDNLYECKAPGERPPGHPARWSELRGWKPGPCECQKCDPIDGGPMPCRKSQPSTSSWQSSNGTR